MYTRTRHSIHGHNLQRGKKTLFSYKFVEIRGVD